MSTTVRTRRSTTTGPPPTRAAPGATEASSNISPRTPFEPGGTSIISSAERSWPSPSVHDDDRKKSSVSFAARKSLAPTDSASQPPRRRSNGYSTTSAPRESEVPGPRASEVSRRRSTPWDAVSYTHGSVRNGSQGGASGAPLTANNLEYFNEKKSRGASTSGSGLRTADLPEVGTGASKRGSRWQDDDADAAATQARSVGQATRRTSRRQYRYEEEAIEEEPGSEHQEVATAASRRRSTRPGMISRPSYAEATEASRRRSTIVGGQTQAGGYSRADANRAPSSYAPSATTRRKSEAVAAAGGAAAVAYAERKYDRAGSDAASPTSERRSSYSRTSGTQARDVYSKSVARRQSKTERQSTVEEDAGSQRNAATEVKSRRDSVLSGRASQAPSQQLQSRALVAGRRSSAAGGTSVTSASTAKPAPGPNPAGVAMWPFSEDAADDAEWERRVHVITTVKPDGRMIKDEEVRVRRLRPSQEQAVVS